MSLYTNKEQRATLTIAMVTAFITTFSGSALNLSIPTIGEEFNSSAALIGWIITSYMLTSSVLSVPFGRLADIKGRETILKMGIFIFTLAGLLSAFSWSMVIMLIFRALQGFGGAMIFATNNAILISSFPSEKKGKVLGFSIASTYVGLTAGPVVGGLFTHYLGWRSIFIFTFIIGITILIVALKKLPKKIKKSKFSSMDYLGNLLYISMIALIMCGLSSIADSSYAKYLIALGLLLAFLFVKHELNTINPIIQIKMFVENFGYTLLNLAALINYGAIFGLGYLLSLYLQIVLGYSPQIAGIILISQPLLMAILSPYAGRLSDKISPFKLASSGMAISALGLLVFVFIDQNTSLWVIIPTLMFIGVGFAFFSSPNTNAIMSCVEEKDYGVASSILATMRSMGHTLSMVLITLIISLQDGSNALSETSPKQLIAIMKVSFTVFTSVCLVGIFFSLKRGTRNKKS